MSNVMIIFLLFAVVLFTSAITFFFQSRVKEVKQYINTFTSSIVAALIFHHILPETYSSGGSIVGVFVLIGLMFQLILERVSGGIEHGHIHSERNDKSKRSVIIGLMLGLCIHSFIEGLPLLASSSHSTTEVKVSNDDDHTDHSAHKHNHNDHSDCGHSEHDHTTHTEEEQNHSTEHEDHSGHNHLTLDANSERGISTFLFAIMQHKIPVTIVLSLFLLSLGISLVKYASLILLFAASTPLGALFGDKLSSLSGFDNIAVIFVSISTGMLLHIVTAILFEHSHSKRSAYTHISLIVCGIAIGVILF